MSVGFSKERARSSISPRLRALLYCGDRPGAIEVKGKDDLAGKSIAVNRGTLEDTSLTEAAPLRPTSSASTTITRSSRPSSPARPQLMVVGNDVGAQVLSRQEALKPEQKFQLLTSPSHMALNKGEDRSEAGDQRCRCQDAGRRHAEQSSEAWLKVPLNPENLKD
jgi:polar amino acid transport system substrate-binding protein